MAIKDADINKLAAVVLSYRVVGLVEYGIVLVPAFHFVEAKLLCLWVVLLKALDLQKEMVKQS